MPTQAAAVSGDRNMSNVKALRLRLASVKSIQRITKTMKMVAAGEECSDTQYEKAVRMDTDSAQLFCSQAQGLPVTYDGGASPR